MNYASLKKHDIANGPGVRVSLFVSGCRHACPGCFNPEAWDFFYGKTFTKAVENEIINALEPPYIKGLSLLGGEPFEDENADCLAPFVLTIRKRYPKKDVWCYTGFTFEELMSRPGALNLLPLTDVLVDGRYMEDQRDITLRFRGSGNQRIIDVPSSLKLGKVVKLTLAE